MGALERAVANRATPADLGVLLLARGEAQARLHEAAYTVKSRTVGRVVRLRGLVEVGNVCVRDCVYCGIRRSNRLVARYTLELREIVRCARRAHRHGYGSLVLQGGERTDAAFADFITEALEQLHAATGGSLGVTLSLGEQTREVYRRWRQAGAHRYLLRLETSDPTLYAGLHPDRPLLEPRRRCLDLLREEGYQVGTGVMIGLPGQTPIQLGRDLMFFQRQDVDMIGMGPYLPHRDTPLGLHPPGYDPGRQLDLGLNMIACARLLLPDANIAATTALQTLHLRGRELGLLAGANVIMPNLTDARYRSSYRLYEGKPRGPENSAVARARLEAAIAALGETVGYRERGDAPRAVARGLVAAPPE